MKRNKNFDCVKMKWGIQQKLIKQFDGISDKDAGRTEVEIIDKNLILGPFIKRVRLLKEKKISKGVPI